MAISPARSACTPCGGVNVALMNATLTGGVVAGVPVRTKYLMGLGCELGNVALEFDEGTETWIKTGWMIELVEGDPPVECDVLMEVSNREPGGVLVTLSRTGGANIAVFENDELWDGDRSVEMHLIYSDKTASRLRWKMRECLQPFISGRCGELPAIGRQVYWVFHSLPLYWVVNVNKGPSCAAGPESFQDVISLPSFDIFMEPVSTELGTCSYKGSKFVEFELAFSMGSAAVYAAGVQFTVEFSLDGVLSVVIEVIGFTGNSASGDIQDDWCISVCLSIVANGCVSHWGAPVSPDFIKQRGNVKPGDYEIVGTVLQHLEGRYSLENGLSLPEYEVTGVMDPQKYKECNVPVPEKFKDCIEKTSTGILRRKLCIPDEADGKYTYWWEVLENNCKGPCTTDLCTPIPPIYIGFSIKLTDEEAESFPSGNLLALVDQEVTFTCECGDNQPYEEPDCEPTCGGYCQYLIAGYSSYAGTFGSTDPTELQIVITSDGSPTGTEIGRVYLYSGTNACTEASDPEFVCACKAGVLYYSELSYWGGSGFPSNDGAVGNIGGSWDCEI